MKNMKLTIETLELCYKLIGNCMETIKELSTNQEKLEIDYKGISEYAMKQKAENLSLEQKLTNILNGIGVNK